MQPVPPDLIATRAELHRLAAEVLSPAREAVTGRIGLRATPGGFGTPVFGDERQLRIEGAELVETEHGEQRRTPIAADATFLGEWFAFATDVLEVIRSERGEEDLVQLWPEHFDVGLGIEDWGTIGGSPGDEHHAEPYLYVSAWGRPELSGPLWNAVEFNGAFLDYRDLLAAHDPRAEALAFLRTRLQALTTDRDST